MRSGATILEDYGEFLESDYYPEWNEKRYDFIVNTLGTEWFNGKTVLDIGCGQGEVSIRLARLGADVTCSDARIEFLTEIKKIQPNVKTIVADVEKDWPFEGKYDLLLNFGLAYHVKDPETLLTKCFRTSDLMFFETKFCVPNTFKPEVFEEQERFDMAFNGVGCRFNSEYIQRIFSKHNVTARRIVGNMMNVTGYVLYNGNNPNTSLNRGFWIVGNLPTS